MLQTLPFGRIDLDTQAHWPQKILACKDMADLIHLKFEAAKQMEILSQINNQDRSYPPPNYGKGVYVG